MVDACPPFDWNITAASINLINNRNSMKMQSIACIHIIARLF